MVADCGTMRRLREQAGLRISKGTYPMKCAHCGKTTTFGHNRSFSMRATNRKFLPNLQKVTLLEKGRKVQKVLCTKCIRTAAKSA